MRYTVLLSVMAMIELSLLMLCVGDVGAELRDAILEIDVLALCAGEVDGVFI